MKDAADTYAVVIQVGAIAAVAILYWSQLSRVLAGLVGRDPAGLRLLRNLVLACIPPVVTALIFKDFIKTELFSVPTVAWALLVGAALMWFVERWRLRRDASAPVGAYATDITAADLSPGRAIAIGFVQCLALWPGMSRSMSAMIGAYFVGLRPVRAAEFSFLLGLPLLGAAAAKDALDGGPAVIAAFGWINVLVGLVIAFISAALAVRLFVGFLTRHGLAPFSIYRILVGIALLVWFAN
jgi:undecaprenyl-diphosphatase